MSSAVLPNKRRRIEQAASTLSKPFKSPLRRAPPTPSTSSPELERKVDGQNASPPIKNWKSDEVAKENSSEEQTTVFATPSQPLQAELPGQHHKPDIKSSSTTIEKVSSALIRLPSSQNPIRTTKTGPAAALHPTDPILSDLQKQQRHLQARLATLKSELDTAQQAVRIESSTKDDELARLIAKWRVVSQEAAEEVFQAAAERIQRMGGMKAWKERTVIGTNNSWWDQQGEMGGADRELGLGADKDADDQTREWFDSLDEEEAASWKAELMGRSDFALEGRQEKTVVRNGEADEVEDEVGSRPLPTCYR